MLLSFFLYLVPSALFLPLGCSVGCLRFLLASLADPFRALVFLGPPGFPFFFFPLDFVSVAHLCCSLGCPAVLPLVLGDYPPSSPSPLVITYIAILVCRLVAYSVLLLFIIFFLVAVLSRLPCDCSLSLSRPSSV